MTSCTARRPGPFRIEDGEDKLKSKDSYRGNSVPSSPQFQSDGGVMGMGGHAPQSPPHAFAGGRPCSHCRLHDAVRAHPPPVAASGRRRRTWDGTAA
jgi:hypothetical protein